MMEIGENFNIQDVLAMNTKFTKASVNCLGVYNISNNS